MKITLEELKLRLSERVDEITLLEILEINASDIVEAFEDRIVDRFDRLQRDMEDEEE